MMDMDISPELFTSISERASQEDDETAQNSRMVQLSKVAQYLEDEEHTDDVLECDGQLWPIHIIKLKEKSLFVEKVFSKKHSLFKVR